MAILFCMRHSVERGLSICSRRQRQATRAQSVLYAPLVLFPHGPAAGREARVKCVQLEKQPGRAARGHEAGLRGRQ